MDIKPRSLSSHEAAIIAWLEAERRRVITAKELGVVFPWPKPTLWNVLHRLAKKGWLVRTGKGHYETILAETAGYAPPNPWAALATWSRPFYIGFQSAAYERGMSPDRPAAVQVCVPVGTRRPLAWRNLPIALVWLRSYAPIGIRVEDLHGWRMPIALPEKVLLDSAALPARVGGLPGLARVLLRAENQIDWRQLRDYAREQKLSGVACRRLAALLELLGRPVPEALAECADRAVPPIFLGERRIYGAKGQRLVRWGVIDNVGAGGLLEEGER